MSPTQLQHQIIYRVLGSISCIGSGYIIQDVLRHPDKRSKSIYHRIMVGLSAMDVLSSFFIFALGSWPMPKGSFVWAVGNMALCEAAAFFGVIGFTGSQFYNCSLATYFSLKLKYNWQDHRIKRIEKWFHIVPCLIALLYCTIALCTKNLGSTGGWCGVTGIVENPVGCSNEPDSELECIRSSEMINKIVFSISLLFPFFSIPYVSITMFRVYKTVRDIEANVIKYSFVARHREQDKKKTMKRSRRIMIQGVLYSVTMILTFIFYFIAFVIILASNKLYPVFNWLILVLTPLQGAFNVLIYLIPVFRKMLKTHRQQKKELEDKAFTNKNGNKETNAAVSSDILSLSGNTLSSSRGNKITSVRFQEEKEEEKQEIAPLPPVFSLETVRENGQDEGSCIYETRNNKNNNNDDGDDYY